MSNARSDARAAFIASFAWLCLLASLAGCSRPSLAALLPRLSLGAVTRRVMRTAAEAESPAVQRWEALALVNLQFRARPVAMDLPARAELAPETWIAPCDADDLICLQEAADAEQQLREAFGELQ